MKLTESRLREIIKEELRSLTETYEFEHPDPDGSAMQKGYEDEQRYGLYQDIMYLLDRYHRDVDPSTLPIGEYIDKALEQHNAGIAGVDDASRSQYLDYPSADWVLDMMVEDGLIGEAY